MAESELFHGDGADFERRTEGNPIESLGRSGSQPVFDRKVRNYRESGNNQDSLPSPVDAFEQCTHDVLESLDGPRGQEVDSINPGGTCRKIELPDMNFTLYQPLEEGPVRRPERLVLGDIEVQPSGSRMALAPNIEIGADGIVAGTVVVDGHAEHIEGLPFPDLNPETQQAVVAYLKAGIEKMKLHFKELPQET